VARKLEVRLTLKDAATAEIKKFDKNARTSAVGVKKLDTSMKTLGGTATRMRGVLGSLFAGLGAAMVLRDMTRTIAGFEQSMAVVKGVTRATAADFDALREKARELGATTVFTAQQAADAMVALSRAGFDANETMTAVGDALNLAAAGNIELAEAADYTAQFIRQYSLAASESQRVTDTVINAANTANTDVRQFADAMRYGAISAKTLGLSIEQTAAMIGVLADRGIKSTLGGTAIRGFLAGLTAESDKAQEALKRMDLDMSDLNVSTLGLSAVLDNLKRGFANIADPMQRAAAAEALFTRRAKDASIILADSGEKIEEKIKLYKELGGEAKRLADAMQNTLGGSFKALRSAIEELYLATGDQGFAGSLKSVVDTVTGAVRALTGMTDETAKITDASRNLAKTIDALTFALGAFVAVRVGVYLISVVNTLWVMTAAMRASIATTIGMASATRVLAVAQGEAAVATAGLTMAMRINPVIAIASAIAALAAAFRWFGSDVAEATAEVKKHDDSLLDLAGSVRAIEAAYAKLGRAKLTKNFEREAQALASIVHQINEQADLLQAAIMKAVKTGAKPVTIKLGDLVKIDPNIEKSDWYKQIVENIRKATVYPTDEDGRTKAALLFAEQEDIAGSVAMKRLAEAATTYGDALKDVQKRLADYRKSQDDVSNADKLRGEWQEALARLQASTQKGLQSYLAGLQDEITVLRTLNSEGAIAAEIMAQRIKLERAGLPYTETQVKLLREALVLRQRLEEQAQKATDTAKRETRVERKEERMPRGFGEGFAAFAGYDVAEKKWRETAFQMADVGNQAASAMFNAFQVQFFDPMTGAFRDLGEIARDFAMTFLQALAQIAAQQAAMMAIKGLSNALGLVGGKTVQAGATGGKGGFGIPGIKLGFKAKGGVYDSSGEVTRFATGGIVTRPTVFPFARGTGLMGEAGPEAIMPLRRGPGGRLGVEGGGGGGQTVNVSVNFAPVINNPKDATGVREEMGKQRELFKQELLRAFADGQVRAGVKGATR